MFEIKEGEMVATKNIKSKIAEEDIKCLCCGDYRKPTEFYKSNSYIFNSIKKIPVCKKCLFEMFDNLVKETEDVKGSLFKLCRQVDIPYIEKAFTNSLTESQSRGTSVFQLYMKNINSLKQYVQYTDFESGETLETQEIEILSSQEIVEDISDRDKKNEEDVIRIVGYDPFEGENLQDRRYLFNRLVDFLDDSTLEDSFKLLTVIEIVKSFNQIDKINASLATMTQDVQGIARNSGGIKSLLDAKKNTLSTVLGMAKDNGISVNHNNNKSKGAGTLSGIIKKLNEIGLEEIQSNLFDIETSSGMEQVADLSNKNIIKQLQFDENDYTDMIAQQREMLLKQDKKLEKLEEENRKLKIQLKEN